jgi:hypothetical protein
MRDGNVGRAGIPDDQGLARNNRFDRERDGTYGDPRIFRSRRAAGVAAILVLSGLTTAGAQPLPRPAAPKPVAKAAKLPVPKQADQDKAEAALKEEYKSLYGAKGKQEDSLTLAVKFLQPGRENRADPAAWFVLLREARDAATRAKRPRLAVEAIDEIDRRFEIEPIAMKLQVLNKISEAKEKDVVAAKAVMKTALDQADDTLAAGNAEATQQLIDVAEAAANAGKKAKPDEALNSLMKKRKQELEAFNKAVKAVAASREKLASAPSDPNTNQAVGQYLCLIEGRWDEGLPLLAKGSDDICSAAKQDLTAPADLKAQIAAGDAWWNLLVNYQGRQERNLMRRAAAWYELALPNATETDQNRLLKRIAEAEDAGRIPNKRLAPGSYAGRGAEDRILLLREAGGTKQSEEAVERGLEWLARHQFENGRWNTNAFQVTKKCNCADRGEAHDIAGTALGLLPFLGAGETHKRGRYYQTVQRGLSYLLSRQKPDGRFHDNAYENGLAALAVCEAYGLSGDRQFLGAPAQAACNFIVSAQDKSGSWGYAAGSAGDTSISGWQFAALKAGHFAGLRVPTESFTTFGSFLETVADSDGLGFGYNKPGAGRATTANGLLAREYLGWSPRHPQMAKIIKQLTPPTNFVNKESPGFYYLYYATQAMHHAGGPAWEAWNPKARDLLIEMQDKGDVEGHEHQKGSWSPKGDDYAKQGGRLMSTALALLALESYYTYIPIHGHGPTVRRD